MNTISSTQENGIHLASSDSTTISDNIISDNEGAGVYIFFTDQTQVLDNVISKNLRGVVFYSSDNGIVDGNLIQENKGEGIWFLLALDNIIQYNNITRNFGYGVSFGASTERNQVIWNNFEDNNGEGSSQAFDSFVDESNDSQPSNFFQSNYWDDWVTSEVFYSIDGEAMNQDNSPLGAPVRGRQSLFPLNPASVLGFLAIAGVALVGSIFFIRLRNTR
jgi:parallel beta-helix repeat protein